MENKDLPIAYDSTSCARQSRELGSSDRRGIFSGDAGCRRLKESLT